MRGAGLLAALLGCLLAGAAQAATVKVLSAAAVEPGLKEAADLYARRTGHTVVVAYATGPEIQARIGGGETGSDIIVAPLPVLQSLRQAGRIAAEPFVLGRVGVAAAVKQGARRPDLSTVEAFSQAVRSADAVIFSRGSTGVYLEGLMQRLELTPVIAAKTVRTPNGAAVVDRVLAGSGAEIGFSAQTELELGRERGLVVLGPIPEAVQNYTVYAAAPFPAAAPARAETAGFVALLRSDESKALMTAKGIR